MTANVIFLGFGSAAPAAASRYYYPGEAGSS
jgi:hypothetical protein